MQGQSLDLFNIFAGGASIISLLIAIFAMRTATKAQRSVQKLSSRFSGVQNVAGSGNVQVGGSYNASKQ